MESHLYRDFGSPDVLHLEEVEKPAPLDDQRLSTVIHEFGHILFMPFGIPILGRTMVILGGSLTEVAFPLLFVGYFLRKREDGRRRDVFAAMVCLWWSPIGLLATAIYCADSRAGKLMLLDGLTGQESEGHDWYNLLGRWGLLEHDTQIARWMRVIAWLMCVGSIAIAVWSALQQPRTQWPSLQVKEPDPLVPSAEAKPESTSPRQQRYSLRITARVQSASLSLAA